MGDKDKNKELYLKIALEYNHDAFNELFFEFYPSLCVFAGRYIDSPETCEDIVQDVFFNIWNNRKTLNIHTSIRNFLATSVRNSCTDYIRKQSSHSKYLENIPFTYDSDTPADIYTIKELQERIEEALSKLPQPAQIAFSLSRTQKMTYKEIAVEMDISPKTVESYISRALKLLREDLKDYISIAIILTYFV